MKIDINKISIAHINGKPLAVFDNIYDCLNFADEHSCPVCEVKCDSLFSFMNTHQQIGFKQGFKK